jgi:hypothetical protein
MTAMTCRLCGQRKARRACPALAHDICPVCCGTKRLVEIRCPSECSWLASARSHPPAVALRQRERDLDFFAQVVRELPERAAGVLFRLQTVTLRYGMSAIPALHDADVRDAAAALAATYETVARGIIYEHQAASLPARRLVAEWREAVDDLAKRAGAGREHVVTRDAAGALRRLEWGAKEARARLEGGEVAFLDLLGRIARELPDGGPEGRPGASAGGGQPPTSEPRIIVP